MTTGVNLEVGTFDTIKNHLRPQPESEVKIFTWTTPKNMKVQVLSYGVTIWSIYVPDKTGAVKDVVLSFDTVEEYQKDNKYFGATIGRTANRIRDAKFTLSGNTYNLTRNVGDLHLHGGIVGFNNVNWNYFIDGTKVIFSYLSKDGEEGYPGDVLTNITYDVTPDNVVKYTMKSYTTKETLVNLTNHCYFNLAGHDTGETELNNHWVMINADNFTASDSNLIQTGEIKPVTGTAYDIKTSQKLEELLKKTENGYDINLCITDGKDKKLGLVSEVVHKPSGRVLKVYSDQPGVQFYTSNFLPDPADPNYQPLKGKNNVNYVKRGAFCLETQNYPDAVNHPNFPSSTLRPGEEYLHEVEYRFEIEN